MKRNRQWEEGEEDMNLQETNERKCKAQKVEFYPHSPMVVVANQNWPNQINKNLGMEL